ncbi:lipoate--protein ligase family protein [Candidatus Enterococcus murrayae]|uniref:Lipoate--protein ligase family protein n=1 Tax=Candidatus Enterococcus murrayae TaxID=2815321 RepID=A0ABS3HBU2_9ENTE|nr:lipoate--protein ligase family protein [Enterococcus sp. MJM16]MBO0450919.1 lipoate--protein ligase family protein [Enterococcus sp. MJM16]
MREALLFDQEMLDESELFTPFALTDVLTEFSGEQQQPIIHFWQLPQTLILGMKDSRVTYFAEALQAVRKENYHLLLRNAGGLGVVSDSGILNVSLILPKDTLSTLSIDDGYEAMVDWLAQTSWGKLGLEVGEVSDSYCPGKYDLSVNGKKIAGIAQRRVKDGVAIMMYLSVNGDQNFRGELVRTYYQKGLKEQFGVDYPPVNPASMTTLNDITSHDVSINAVKKELLQTMPHNDQTEFLANFYQLEEYQRRIKNIQQRNLIIQEVFHDL